jgi:hypothetical protein
MYAWLATLLIPIIDLIACVQQTYQFFDIDNASGSQLDTIGEIVGVSRVLPFQPTEGTIQAIFTEPVSSGLQTVTVSNTVNMTVGSVLQSPAYRPGRFYPIDTFTLTAIVPNVSITANFNYNHNTGQSLYGGGQNLNSTLGDSDYRSLLYAKIAQNNWDGSTNQIFALINKIYPGATIIFIDNQNMTATIILAGGFTEIQQNMLLNGLIIPRPQAVLYNFTTAELPVLGFDQNTADVAGLDVGHFI